MDSLARLPAIFALTEDILLEITRFARVEDVIALGQVILGALSHIPLPFHPHASRSDLSHSPIHQLKATLRVADRLLQNWAHSNPRPRRTVRLNSPLACQTQWHDPFVRIVPGANWVVTAKSIGAVQWWSIQNRTSPECVGVYWANRGIITSLDATLSKEGHEILVAISVYSVDTGATTIKLLSICLTGSTAREAALERMTIDLHPTMTLERVSMDGNGRAASVVWMANERRSVILVADCRRRTCGIYTTPYELEILSSSVQLTTAGIAICCPGKQENTLNVSIFAFPKLSHADLSGTQSLGLPLSSVQIAGREAPDLSPVLQESWPDRSPSHSTTKLSCLTLSGPDCTSATRALIHSSLAYSDVDGGGGELSVTSCTSAKLTQHYQMNRRTLSVGRSGKRAIWVEVPVVTTQGAVGGGGAPNSQPPTMASSGLKARLMGWTVGEGARIVSSTAIGRKVKKDDGGDEDLRAGAEGQKKVDSGDGLFDQGLRVLDLEGCVEVENISRLDFEEAAGVVAAITRGGDLHVLYF